MSNAGRTDTQITRDRDEARLALFDASSAFEQAVAEARQAEQKAKQAQAEASRLTKRAHWREVELEMLHERVAELDRELAEWKAIQA